MKNVKVVLGVMVGIVVVGVIALGVIGVRLEESFQIDSISDVAITSGNARVEVRHASDDVIRAEATDAFPFSELIIEENNDRLTIDLQTPWFARVQVINVTRPALVVYLPTTVYNAVSIRTSNGSIEISDFEIEQLNLRTSNGNIDVSDIQGNVEVQTSNGRVEASRLNGEAHQFTSSNGRLQLANIAGDITGTTRNGSIDFDNPTLEQDLNLRTSNGSVTVALSEQPEDAQFRLRTNNGRINLFGLRNEQQTFGNGQHEVEIRTSNGRITVG